MKNLNRRRFQDHGINNILKHFILAIIYLKGYFWLFKILFISVHEYKLYFRSVQFSCSVVSNSLQPHESQHTRPPCPSPTPRVHSTHIHRDSDTIQPSHPLSSLSPPAPNPSQYQSFPMSQLFT